MSESREWFDEKCQEWRARFGERGWKHKLAEALNVSDSNVQNWLRAGEVPPIVRTAIDALEERDNLNVALAKHQSSIKFVIAKLSGEERFAVMSLEECGQFEIKATFRELQDAKAFIQFCSGEIDRKIRNLTEYISVYSEEDAEMRRYVFQLENW